MQRVINLVGLQEREVEELLYGRRRQRLILLDRKRRQSVPGLRGDHDPEPPGAMTLPNASSTSAVPSRP